MNMEIFRNSEFGSIRVIEEDGKYLFWVRMWQRPWGQQSPKAVRDHARVEQTFHPHRKRYQTMTFLPEGVYRLIVHSRCPARSGLRNGCSMRCSHDPQDRGLDALPAGGGGQAPRSFSPLRTSSWRSMRRTAAFRGGTAAAESGFYDAFVRPGNCKISGTARSWAWASALSAS